MAQYSSGHPIFKNGKGWQRPDFKGIQSFIQGAGTIACGERENSPKQTLAVLNENTDTFLILINMEQLPNIQQSYSRLQQELLFELSVYMWFGKYGNV